LAQNENVALQKLISEGFSRIEQRLDGIEDGIHDMQQGLHGLMLKLLRAEEINEIRSKMKKAPDMKNFPTWVIR